MTEGLPCYRAYLLGAGGGITDVDVIEAANDVDAVAALRGMRNVHGIELWDRDRRIVTAAPEEAAPCDAAPPRDLAASEAGAAAAGR